MKNTLGKLCILSEFYAIYTNNQLKSVQKIKLKLKYMIFARIFVYAFIGY